MISSIEYGKWINLIDTKNQLYLKSKIVCGHFSPSLHRKTKFESLKIGIQIIATQPEIIWKKIKEKNKCVNIMIISGCFKLYQSQIFF